MPASAVVLPPAASTAAGRPVIEMKNATKRFGDSVAVENLNFNVHEGEIFGFIGPSGSGKTTTIRLMNGTYQPTEGSATVFGQRAGSMSGRTRESIGYLAAVVHPLPEPVGQGEHRLLRVAVRHELVRPSQASPGGARVRRAVGSPGQARPRHFGRHAAAVSGSPRSLIHDPRLIFLDEPTAGIDPIFRAKFWDAFRELKAQGRSLFVTTQYVTEAEFCDHVAVLGHGRIIAVDTPENLRSFAFGGDMIDVSRSADRPRDPAAVRAGAGDPVGRHQHSGPRAPRRRGRADGHARHPRPAARGEHRGRGHRAVPPDL